MIWDDIKIVKSGLTTKEYIWTDPFISEDISQISHPDYFKRSG